MLESIAAGYVVEVAGPEVRTGAGPVHNIGNEIESLPVRSPRATAKVGRPAEPQRNGALRNGLGIW